MQRECMMIIKRERDPKKKKCSDLRNNVLQGSIGEWHRCNSVLKSQYKGEVVSSVPYHVNLSAKGYRSLIYR